MQSYIKAKVSAFGNFIDPDRKLVDLPNMALVEVDLPEYARNGLGRALMKVMRYQFTDLGAFGVEGMSLCAETSRGQMIYEDMNPQMVGLTHTEVQNRAPKELIKSLYAGNLPIEMITLAALRHQDFPDLDALVAFLDKYHRRASWLESHPVEVRFANLEAEFTGEAVQFPWFRLVEGER